MGIADGSCRDGAAVDGAIIVLSTILWVSAHSVGWRC